MALVVFAFCAHVDNDDRPAAVHAFFCFLSADGIKSIFILPPSLDELENRLIGRGQDNAEVIADRMAKAISEISHYNEYDYVIVNDNFEQALADLQAILRAERLTLTHQQQENQGLIEQLLDK